ncbi:unnamed protein product [Moneuplotes crassus]|uniref:Uncharacterized protein n=1 Tax=Euplotes crassus TaxID=5936 RepID=A0AAD1U6E0_EUPCR|nr:unnamed protein product [Moneuplotes crassus]
MEEISQRTGSDTSSLDFNHTISLVKNSQNLKEAGRRNTSKWKVQMRKINFKNRTSKTIVFGTSLNKELCAQRDQLDDSQFLQNGISNLKKPYVPDFGYEGATPEILFGTAKKGWALIADSILSFPRLESSSRVIKKIAKKVSSSRKSMKNNKMGLNLCKLKRYNKSLNSSLGSPVRPRTEMENFSFNKVVRISPELEEADSRIKLHKPVKKFRMRKRSKNNGDLNAFKRYPSRIVKCREFTESVPKDLNKRNSSCKRSRKFRLQNGNTVRLSNSLQKKDLSNIKFCKTKQKIREFLSNQSGPLFDANINIRNFDMKNEQIKLVPQNEKKCGKAISKSFISQDPKELKKLASVQSSIRKINNQFHEFLNQDLPLKPEQFKNKLANHFSTKLVDNKRLKYAAPMTVISTSESCVPDLSESLNLRESVNAPGSQKKPRFLAISPDSQAYDEMVSQKNKQKRIFNS